MKKMRESWKPAPVSKYAEVYKVSSNGRIKNRKGKILKLSVNKGYSFITFCINREAKKFPVHRLVINAFSENPFNKPCVNHKNSNRGDNRIENLEWVTHKENIQHALNSKRMYSPKGTDCHFAVLKEKDIFRIRYLYEKEKMKISEIAKTLNIAHSTVYYAANRMTWKHI